MSLSSANWTSISWFSIFHSEFPFFWLYRQNQNWQMGSPALQIFKKLGYKIRVYSSAKIEFYGMDKLIFGNQMNLIDSYQTFHHEAPKKAWESDRDALYKMQNDLAANPELAEGQLCIVFWDATHFDYSFPKQAHAPFRPTAGELSFFRAYPTKKNREKIKNKYRNAIYYMDKLFGEFMEKVDSQALIAFTGDHGEEFFDHGHLFHGSHLTQEQIRVPILFRIGTHGRVIPLLSQIDIFPTLLDAVAGKTFSFLSGESALRPKQWPFTATARFNARRAPYEFCLEDGHHKLIAQFANKRDIYDSTSLRILSLKNAHDKTCYTCEGNIQEWIEAEFGPALSRLFRYPDRSSKIGI